MQFAPAFCEISAVSRRRVLVIIGTRPEAIKLFPVVRALKALGTIEVVTCVTGQHREMVDAVLAMAGLAADVDLDLLSTGQTLDTLTGRLIGALGMAMDRLKPELVVVQGDTVSAMTGALAACYRRIPVAHVEAGLRSGTLHDPCPEEPNRRIIGALAALHLAPTEAAVTALRRENAGGSIHLTGNTGIDAVRAVHEQVTREPALALETRSILKRFGDRRIIFATAHRRESIAAIDHIAAALLRLSERLDAAILLPLHPNPQVGTRLRAKLDGVPNIALTTPLDYPNAVAALAACHIVLTDSGGLQEEAPFFGKPVLVMRDTTERPEGIAAGTAKLVGTQEADIVAAAGTLLDSEACWNDMARRHLPYGSGHASGQIALLIESHLRRSIAA